MLSIRDEQQTRDDDAARHLLITPCGDRIVLMGEAGDFLLGPEGGAMLHRQAEREEDARAAAAELEHEAAAAASLSLSSCRCTRLGSSARKDSNAPTPSSSSRSRSPCWLAV